MKAKRAAPKRHRHEASCWVMSGGRWLWCYQCGAVRKLRPAADKSAPYDSEPDGPWVKPTGIGGRNPA